MKVDSVFLLRIILAVVCGFLVFIGIQMAGNDPVGLYIYFSLFHVFGVPQTEAEYDFLFTIAGVILGLAAMIPAILVVITTYSYWNRNGFRFSLHLVLVVVTWLGLFLATVFMFRNFESEWIGHVRFLAFTAVDFSLVWYLIHNFRSIRRVASVVPPE